MAICTDPQKQNNQWSKEEFFATADVKLKSAGMRADSGFAA